MADLTRCPVCGYCAHHTNIGAEVQRYEGRMAKHDSLVKAARAYVTACEAAPLDSVPWTYAQLRDMDETYDVLRCAVEAVEEEES